MRRLSPERRSELIAWKLLQQLSTDKAIARRLHVSRATIWRLWDEDLHAVNSLRQKASLRQVLACLNSAESGKE